VSHLPSALELLHDFHSCLNVEVTSKPTRR
jgi:hypothetical protein